MENIAKPHDERNRYILFYADPVAPCPPSNPFTFDNGSKCCKFQKTFSETMLLYKSKSCQNNDYLACPRCENQKEDCACKDNYGMV